MARSVYLAAPVPRAIGGFQQHLRNIARALERPIGVLEYGSYGEFHKVADFSPNATVVGQYPRRSAFAARLIGDYLTKPQLRVARRGGESGGASAGERTLGAES